MFVCKALLGKGTESVQSLPNNTGLPTIKISYFFHLWTLDRDVKDDFGCSTLRELDKCQLHKCCGAYSHPFSCECSLIGRGTMACSVSN